MNAYQTTHQRLGMDLASSAAGGTLCFQIIITSFAARLSRVSKIFLLDSISDLSLTYEASQENCGLSGAVAPRMWKVLTPSLLCANESSRLCNCSFDECCHKLWLSRLGLIVVFSMKKRWNSVAWTEHSPCVEVPKNLQIRYSKALCSEPAIHSTLLN